MGPIYHLIGSEMQHAPHIPQLQVTPSSSGNELSLGVVQ